MVVESFYNRTWCISTMWCYLGCRIYRHPLFVLAEILEFDHAIDLCKKGVITTATYVGARMNFGSELTYDNIAGLYNLAAKSFYATPLTFTVACHAAADRRQGARPSLDCAG